MPALDIFSSSAFSMVALTDAINKMPYVPGRIGQLGLFREQGFSTTSVMIEEREGSLNLVETTARGAPAIQNTTNKRKARSLVVPHIALEDTILADEVQNVRAFGSESMLEGVQAVVNQRMSEMATKMDATLEHLRIGAIKGQILDADGSAVIYDLFTEFGVTQHTEIDFDLDNATPAPGAVKKKCHDIRRKVEDELGAQPYDHVHAICGADFFDDLITHSEVAKAYDRYLDGAFLRQGQARGSFEYSGILFEEYRGRVGTVDFTDASKAYFFPVGVPGLFRQYNAPADFVETANTIGLPRYAKQAVDQQFARWVMLHVQSNPLPICTRPRVLIKGKRT
jgi:Phage major capsid protein E